LFISSKIMHNCFSDCSDIRAYPNTLGSRIMLYKNIMSIFFCYLNFIFNGFFFFFFFLFVCCSFFNHSCVPNAGVQTSGPEGVVTSIKPIKNGEHIFISYTDTAAPKQTRTVRLMSYGITCNCVKCATEM
jgi:hypothetical protein